MSIESNLLWAILHQPKKMTLSFMFRASINFKQLAFLIVLD